MQNKVVSIPFAGVISSCDGTTAPLSGCVDYKQRPTEEVKGIIRLILFRSLLYMMLSEKSQHAGDG